MILKCNLCHKELDTKNKELNYIDFSIGCKNFMFITCDRCKIRCLYQYNNTLFGKEIIMKL